MMGWQRGWETTPPLGDTALLCAHWDPGQRPLQDVCSASPASAVLGEEQDRGASADLL